MKPVITNKIWDNYFHYYDGFLLKFNPYTRWLRELKHIVEFYINRLSVKRINIIDLGCGTGNLINQLVTLRQKYRLNITGIDYTKYALELARNKVGQKALFYEANLGEHNFGMAGKQLKKIKKYHIVIVSNVFYSLSHKQKDNMLAEIKKLLHKKGFLIISEPQKLIGIFEIIKNFIRTAGKFQLIKFLASLFPELYQVKQIMQINKNYLDKTISVEGTQQKLLANNGFKLNSCFQEVYMGSNSVEIYTLARSLV